jgi:COP9 signalosome complex subunit 3
MYSVALEFLSDTDIVEISPIKSPLTTQDFLRYFYYAGIVYTTLRKYKEALDSFDQVLSTPAHALSAIAVETFRKAMLVSLLAHGQPYTVPRSASPQSTTSNI